MNDSVLLLGGYGNFGKRIALGLLKKKVAVTIVGRNAEKAAAFAAEHASPLLGAAAFEIGDLPMRLHALRPHVVINACGPFQLCDYAVAEQCIAHGVHYIDLADARAYVKGFAALDQAARRAGVCAITGASSVPGLSAAVVEHYLPEFSAIESMRFGISPGQRAERGLATTQAIMTYVGKRLEPTVGQTGSVYGWQDVHRQHYPGLGKRWMAACEVPDLDLLPARYGIRQIRFYAGLELGAMHLGLWLCGWLVRLGLPLNLPDRAEFLLKASNWFNRYGSDAGGMHVILRGRDQNNRPHERKWFLVVEQGNGPQIPCVPAILLAQRLVHGAPIPVGAYPCVGLISLQDYLAELGEFGVKVSTA